MTEVYPSPDVERQSLTTFAIASGRSGKTRPFAGGTHAANRPVMASKQLNRRINLFLTVALALLNGCGDFSTNGDGSMTQMIADAIVSRLGGTDFKFSETTASAGG